MVAGTKKKALVVGGALVAAALVGACAWYVGTATGVTSADAEGAPALGNTLDNNDTAEKGELTVYDPAAEAAASGGVAIEGSDEEKLQQERIAGGAVGGRCFAEPRAPRGCGRRRLGGLRHDVRHGVPGTRSAQGYHGRHRVRFA